MEVNLYECYERHSVQAQMKWKRAHTCPISLFYCIESSFIYNHMHQRRINFMTGPKPIIVSAARPGRWTYSPLPLSIVRH